MCVRMKTSFKLSRKKVRLKKTCKPMIQFNELKICEKSFHKFNRLSETEINLIGNKIRIQNRIFRIYKIIQLTVQTFEALSLGPLTV